MSERGDDVQLPLGWCDSVNGRFSRGGAVGAGNCNGDGNSNCFVEELMLASL